MARRPNVRYFPSRGGYYCQWEGKQHKLAVGPDDGPTGPTYLEALGEFKRVIERASVRVNGDKGTVAALAMAYLDWVESKKKAGTYTMRKRHLRLFAERWPDLAISAVTPYHAETIVAEMGKGRMVGCHWYAWGEGTARTFLTSLKAMFNWGVRKRFLNRSPVAEIQLCETRTKARERLVERSEHDRIVASLTGKRAQPLRRIILALENTGARPGELTSATVADWDDKRGLIVYYGDDKRREDEFAHKTSGKGKDRFIYFTGEVLDMVRELVRGKKRTDRIFTNSQGKPYGSHGLYGAFRAIGERFSLPHYMPYAYRHTLATRWLEQGKPIEWLAELLGNTPGTIRKHYSHLCRAHDTLRSALEDFRRSGS